MHESVLMSWSGGKDSALALHELLKTGQFHIAALLTTVTETYDRVSMHGVRRVLLERQADELGIPLEQIRIPAGADNREYESKMREVLERHKDKGVNAVAFGDIFLQDLKKYRESNLAQIGMTGIFPIWRRDSRELARRFIELGFRAITTCVDSQRLDRRFVGRAFDMDFVNDLPPEADPCGENGEFHSFAFAGPIFRNSIQYSVGEVVLRDNRFYFCDLLPPTRDSMDSSRGNV